MDVVPVFWDSLLTSSKLKSFASKDSAFMTKPLLNMESLFFFSFAIIFASQQQIGAVIC